MIFLYFLLLYVMNKRVSGILLCFGYLLLLECGSDVGGRIFGLKCDR